MIDWKPAFPDLEKGDPANGFIYVLMKLELLVGFPLPAGPKDGDTYYNTVDNCVYTYIAHRWTKMSGGC